MLRIPFSSTGGPLTAISFCPFDSSPDFLAVATTTSLHILNAKEKYQPLFVQTLGSPLTAWSWSPETTTSSVVLALAGQDTRIHIYHSKLGLLNIPGLNPLKMTVTDLTFDQTRGHLLALLTIDKFLKIYAFDSTQESILDRNGVIQVPDCLLSWPLASRGITVSFHSFLSDHLFLAEESGSIRFLNLQTKEWIFSVQEPAMCHSPYGLRSADWNPSDPNVFGAVIGDQWFVWNLAESPIHIPSHTGDAHSQGSLQFKWSRTSPRTFALTGLPNPASKTKSIKIFESLLKKVPVVLEAPVPLQGLTFHALNGQMIVYGTHHLFEFSNM